jgi:hypothetical protein
MNGLGPGQNDVRAMCGQCRGAERVVSCIPSLFGRWEHEERELGRSVDLENSGWRGIVTGVRVSNERGCTKRVGKTNIVNAWNG